MFKCEFSTDNDAFANGDMGAETARILRSLAVAVERGRDAGRVIDANGNHIGRWFLDTDE